MTRRAKKSKTEISSVSQADRSSGTVIPANKPAAQAISPDGERLTSRAKKAKTAGSQADRSLGPEILANTPAAQQSQPTAPARIDCPGRDVISSGTRKRDRESPDKSQGTVTAVNADDPSQQLQDYDEFVV